MTLSPPPAPEMEPRGVRAQLLAKAAPRRVLIDERELGAGHRGEVIEDLRVDRSGVKPGYRAARCSVDMSSVPVTIADSKPKSMLMFWPLTNDEAGLATQASAEATSRADTRRPPA